MNTPYDEVRLKLYRPRRPLAKPVWWTLYVATLPLVPVFFITGAVHHAIDGWVHYLKGRAPK